MRIKIIFIFILFFISVGISTAQVNIAQQQKPDEITELNLDSFDSTKRNDSIFIASIKNGFEIEPGFAAKDSVNQNKNVAKSKSFFSSELFYFIGTAAIAAIIYVLLPDDNADAEKKLTFGKPPTPK